MVQLVQLLFVSLFAFRQNKENKSMEALELPVTYYGIDLCLKAHVIRFGYVQYTVVDLLGN